MLLWRMNIQQTFFIGGDFVLHKITGNFEGRVSAWYEKDGKLMDAEVIRGNKSYPVKRNGPIWDLCISKGQIYKK